MLKQTGPAIDKNGNTVTETSGIERGIGNRVKRGKTSMGGNVKTVKTDGAESRHAR